MESVSVTLWFKALGVCLKPYQTSRVRDNNLTALKSGATSIIDALENEFKFLEIPFS